MTPSRAREARGGHHSHRQGQRDNRRSRRKPPEDEGSVDGRTGINATAGCGASSIGISYKTQNIDECPICLEDFTSESPAVFLGCGHAFHLHCIYEWLERSSNCAVCQTLVKGYDDDDDSEDKDVDVDEY